MVALYLNKEDMKLQVVNQQRLDLLLGKLAQMQVKVNKLGQLALVPELILALDLPLPPRVMPLLALILQVRLLDQELSEIVVEEREGVLRVKLVMLQGQGWTLSELVVGVMCTGLGGKV